LVYNFSSIKHKTYNVLCSVQHIFIILIVVAIYLSCNSQSKNISSVENLGVSENVIESNSNVSFYQFENHEYYYRAYYSDFPRGTLRFSFYDGIFYMDIPELDYGKYELGGPIKEIMQGQYTIIEENGFVYILVLDKKFLVLYTESLMCVLIDCQNNDAFFGLNKDSIYWITGRSPFFPANRVSSFLTETLRDDRTIKYDGSKEKYYYELTKPWVEGEDDHGIGEWIETTPGTDVFKIVFFNGFINPNRPDLFYANSRIKEVNVSTEWDSWTFQIQDTPNPQILPLPDRFNDILHFTIKDVYEGTRYSDTCLAGIYFLRIRGQ